MTFREKAGEKWAGVGSRLFYLRSPRGRHGVSLYHTALDPCRISGLASRRLRGLAALCRSGGLLVHPTLADLVEPLALRFHGTQVERTQVAGGHLSRPVDVVAL